MKQNYLDILIKYGYCPIDHGFYAKFAALWREGNDKNSVTLYYDTGISQDHVTGETYQFHKLLELITGDVIPDIDKFFKANNFQPILNNRIPKLYMPKVYDKQLLENLVKDYAYWNKRGIGNEILEKLGCGVSNIGATKDRVVFPIINEKEELVGFAARDITGTKENKWKLFGSKSEWTYPLFLPEVRKQIIDKSEIIIVESIGDFLSCAQCGIYNVVVAFGLESLASINVCIRYSPKKIIIATNNDNEKSTNYGLEAAEKIKARFCKYFSPKSIEIRLPKVNDLNELLIKEGQKGIIEWYQVKV